MRTRHILVATMTTSLLGMAPVGLTATPAQSATLSSRIFLAPQALSVYRAGSTITIRGQVQVRGSDGKWYFVPPTFSADDTVKLFRTPRGGDRKLVRTVRLDRSRGIVAFRVKSRGNASYSLAYSGASNGGDTYRSASVRRAIKGSRNPHGRGVLRKGRAFYVGDVNPGWGNRRVTVQRKACQECGWKRFTRVRTNKAGRYAVHVGAPRKGSWWFRAKVPATLPRFAVGFGNQIRTYSVESARVDAVRARVGVS